MKFISLFSTTYITNYLISSVESQNGIIAVHSKCSVENQKGAIAVHSLYGNSALLVFKEHL